MTVISTYSAIWASDSTAKKPILTDAKIALGFSYNELAYLEYFNYFFYGAQNKMNEIIGLWNLSETNIHDSTLTFNDNIDLSFGDSADAKIKYSTENSGQLRIGVPSSNKTLSLLKEADIDLSLSTANTLYPKFMIHNTSAPATVHCDFHHDGAYATMDSTAAIYFYTSASTKPVVIGTVFSTAHSLNSRNDMLVNGDVEVKTSLYADGSVEVKGQTYIDDCPEILCNLTELSTGTTSYTATVNDHYIQFLYTGTANLSVTLPSSCPIGHTLIVSKGNSSGDLTFYRSGTGTIDGSTAWGGFTAPYTTLTLVSVSTTGNYYFVSHNQ